MYSDVCEHVKTEIVALTRSLNPLSIPTFVFFDISMDFMGH